MNEKMVANITSEFGKLEGVIIHSPGLEVEEMTPGTAKRALYSDILNLSVAQKEYEQFKGVISKVSKCFEVNDLLTEVLKDEEVKKNLLSKICSEENIQDLFPNLISADAANLSKRLIQGVPIIRDNLTRYLSNERFSLSPLHNFLFTRDASMVYGNNIFIGKMANKVRDREALIMEAIFKNHPLFEAQIINPSETNQSPNKLSLEGGDFLVARKDVLIIGTGIRTSTRGIDFVLQQIKNSTSESRHIIIQELPDTPESFIHLDMVFTLLDYDSCMIFEPLIMGTNRFHTIHIHIEGGQVQQINEEANLLQALRKTGIDLHPIYCGGSNNAWTQEREQWHSGANFLTIAPGQIIGYERNMNTIEELNKNGFEVIRAKDIIAGEKEIPDNKKCVITIAGSELARGGGGARYMSMPFRRKDI